MHVGGTYLRNNCHNLQDIDVIQFAVLSADLFNLECLKDVPEESYTRSHVHIGHEIGPHCRALPDDLLHWLDSLLSHHDEFLLFHDAQYLFHHEVPVRLQGSTDWHVNQCI